MSGVRAKQMNQSSTSRQKVLKRTSWVSIGVVSLLLTLVVGIAGLMYLGHRLVVLRDCGKEDISGTLAPMGIFIPNNATDVQFASRPGRLWFYARFHCDEDEFRNWFEAMGVNLQETDQLSIKETFDFYYGFPDRQPTIIERGLMGRGSVGSFQRLRVHFDKDQQIGYVYNDNRVGN